MPLHAGAEAQGYRQWPVARYFNPLFDAPPDDGG